MDKFFVALTEALTYAAVSQQVEVTPATVAVYYDQLQGCTIAEIQVAVKTWVREYDESYRRLPTIGELRSIIRRGKSTTPAIVIHEMRAAGIVSEARAAGKSQAEIDELLAKHDATFQQVAVR